MLSTTALFSLSSQTSLFSKTELPHQKTSLISIPHLKLLSSHCPHLLTQRFTNPSSAKLRRRVMVDKRNASRANHRPLSQLFPQKSKGILYIWAIYIFDLLVIARYFASLDIESKIGDEKLASLIFFIFFFPFFFLVWCLGFRIWFEPLPYRCGPNHGC